MRQKIENFTVDGKPLLLPDGPVEARCTDILSPESGRDESGRLHRFVLRNKLRSWKFAYRDLTGEEKTYLQALTFLFGAAIAASAKRKDHHKHKQQTSKLFEHKTLSFS